MRPERLIYTGNGAFRFGVPARDLEARDIRRLSDGLLAEITTPNPTTGRAMYEAPKRPSPRVTKAAAEAVDETAAPAETAPEPANEEEF